ncbi:DUF2726 domain-containing protein [Piscinibacter aquaticus]|uniref:DUF2726 domain-containing protein n=1 Tax=Piscinibacter aquaticus TaxID=392597 RepID=A0A5C6U4V8_9BURK|nr:DUF2726 domain-containing protein [Piscinibacter aquaticus]
MAPDPSGRRCRGAGRTGGSSPPLHALATGRRTPPRHGGRLAPAATRILTSAERRAYSTLERALPGYMILAQVPLARFLKVPTRNSYTEWLRRMGTQCADLVVCDMASEVLAVVNVQPPAGSESERARKRLNRMARVLKAAGIPMHVWTDNALPSVEAAREMVMPKAASAAPQATPAARPNPLEEAGRDDSLDERIEVREPPPSTWFDEFSTSPAPLSGTDKRSG